MSVFDFNKVDLNRKIRVGLGFSLFILVLSSFISYYSIKELISHSKWVDHTNEVIIELDKVLSIAKDAETGQRGYLITGKDEFLEPYHKAHDKMDIAVEHVRHLTEDNMTQQLYIDTLKPLLDMRIGRLDAVLDSYHRNNKLVSVEDMQEGKRIMDDCQRIVKNMQNEEYRLLKTRAADAERFANVSPIIIAASSLFALFVSIFSFYFINRDIKHKEITQKELFRHNYLLNGMTSLDGILRGEKNLHAAGEKILSNLSVFMKAQAGVLYILDDHGKFDLSNYYAFDINSSIPKSFRIGEGLLGQSALERKRFVLDNIPAGSIKIESGLTSSDAANILIVPFHYNGHTVAVIELISTGIFEALDLEFIDSTVNTISIFLNGIKSEIKTLELLAETQNQAEELEAQQEELRQINQETLLQRDRLQASEEELRASEEELQEKNAELEEKSNELEEQYEAVRAKNLQLETAKSAVQLKMDQVETISKYKSDFLANMSHELRTPLNSILILARILKDNKNETLSEKEMAHAGIIEKSGNDLLKLINEILDLARIESGKVKLELNTIPVSELSMEQFKDLAKEKAIQFNVTIAKDVPTSIHTDKFRLEQVLKNLLSNAFKFTEKEGTIEYNIHLPEKHILFSNSNLTEKNSIAFSIKDNGIGIPDEKKNLIFEAFQQADLSTTRKFGGSGLGLTISRDLASLLGGEIQFESKLGNGSSFTLYVPFHLADQEITESALPHATSISIEEAPFASKTKDVVAAAKEARPDDKNSLLIIEDDFYFCNILADYAEKKGYVVYTANTGNDGYELARTKRPDAILLDIQLPDTNGWEVLRKIKNNASLKKIPVHLMSAYDKEGSNDLGQANFIAKPVTLEVLDNALGKIKHLDEKILKKVLIVEDNETENNAVKELLDTQNVYAESAFNGAEAIRMLEERSYDCVILDINLPDMTGYQVLEIIKKKNALKSIPVIIYSGKELSEAEEAAYRRYANTIIIKTEYSYTRLLEEVKLFLYSMDQNLKKMESVMKSLHKSEIILKDKKVLIADDDMRNIYSLTNILEDQGMHVIVSYDGKQAITELENNPDVDIILMDIMMPEMDGIEATKIIRSKTIGKTIPIIAVTAKAMPGDKERCLEAGVSDYISKPIDITKLISLMRVWLYQQ